MAVPNLKAQRAADIDRLYDPDLPWVTWADPVGWPAGSPLEFLVRMDHSLDESADMDYRWPTAVARVRKADWEAPNYGDKIAIDGQTWTVDRVRHQSEIEWLVVLVTDVRVSF